MLSFVFPYLKHAGPVGEGQTGDQKGNHERIYKPANKEVFFILNLINAFAFISCQKVM